MFLAELFPQRRPTTEPATAEIEGLSRIPPKFLPLLKRLAKFHGIKDLEFDPKTRKWHAKKGSNIGPFVNDATYMTSAAGSGIELSMHESEDRDIKVFDEIRTRNTVRGIVIKLGESNSVIFRSINGQLLQTSLSNCQKI